MKSLWFGPLVALSLCGPALAADPSCQLKQSASLDMNTEPNGTISVPGTVNNLPVMMLVDTGSVFSSLSSDIVDSSI